MFIMQGEMFFDLQISVRWREGQNATVQFIKLFSLTFASFLKFLLLSRNLIGDLVKKCFESRVNKTSSHTTMTKFQAAIF